MKFVLFIIFFQLGITAQAQFFEEIYLGLDLKNKSEFNTVLKQSKYIINKNTDSPTLLSFPSTHFFLGLVHKEKYGVEFGYFNELYFAGIYTKTPDGVLCGKSSSKDLIHNYYLKVNYMLYKYKKFSIYSEFSFIYGSARYWDGGILNISGPQCKDMYIKDYNEKYIDWGLHKYYLFLNGDLKMEYKFKKKYSISTSVGYNQGFKTLGYARGYYIYKNEPKQYFKNETKGSNMYFTIGLKYHYVVNPKEESILMKKGNREYLWDNNFHFYAGISSSVDIIDDNLSIMYLPKFGISLEIRKKRFSVSNNIYYLNRNINYYNILTDRTQYDQTNGTYSLIDIYTSFRGVEFNEAFNYYFYFSKKFDMYGGIGFFRLSIVVKRDQYNITHSDSYSKVYGNYIRNSYAKSGWLFNFGGIYKLNRKVRLNASFDVKNMGLYKKITRIVVLPSEYNNNPVLSLNLKIEYDL